MENIPGIGPVLAAKLGPILKGRSIWKCWQDPAVSALLPEYTKLFFKYKPVQDVPRALLVPFVEGLEKRGAIVAGSYRRQRDTCNDLDILIEKGREHLILDLFVSPIVCGPEIIRTFCKIKNLYIQCDIFMYTDLAPYLLYATGSKEFNMMMRAIAKKKGYLLNQHGLFKEGVKIPLKTEAAYFEILNIKWRDPPQRTISTRH